MARIRDLLFSGLFLGLFSWGTAVMAQAPATDYSQWYDDRWYLQLQGGAVLSDSSDLDSGGAGYLSIGKPITSLLNLQFDFGYANLGTDDAGDYERLTAGVTGVFHLLRGPNVESLGGLRPYLLASANLHRIDFLGDSSNGYGFQAGAGVSYPLSRLFEFVAEGRYGLDEVSDVPVSPGVTRDETFYTWTATAGIRMKLGSFPPDSDGDGVPDHLDECPGTPRGVTVDRRGCPIDSDGDGVPDHLDRCPGTPEGAPVDEHGCPLDSDGDGVPDYLDECPGTPAGVRVDARGCPWKDSDGDGVPDHLDRCPNTPPGVPVDEFGCPLDSDGDGIPDYLDECPFSPPGAAVLPGGCALVGDRRIARPGEQADADGFATGDRARQFILDGVTFEFDSAQLTAEAREILNRVAETLKAYPGIKVDVEGHTDNIGSAAYNLGLSERRALSVRTYLISRGIPGDQMRPVGYGLSVPIDSNDTESGRANNRRVEFSVR
jgi:OOP family OmpA-OmpF porin